MTVLSLKVTADQTGLAQMRGLLRELQGTVSSGAALSQGVRSLRGEMTQLSATQEKSRVSTQKLRTELASSKQELVELRAANKGLKTELDQVRVAMDKSGAGARNHQVQTQKATVATDQFRSALRGAAGALGGLWMTYGKDVILLTAFYALTRAVKDTSSATMELNRTLRMIQAVSSQTSEQISNIGDELLRIDAIQGPRELAEGMRVMAKAGVEAQESIKGIQSIAVLAMSDDAQMEATAKMVTRIMKVYELAGKDIPRITDTIAYAAAQSNMELQDFANAMSQSTELSTLMKISLDETAAAMMVLHDHGIAASKAGTSLRTSLLRLLAPTPKAQEMMERLGFSATQADGSLKSLREIVEDLSSAMEGLSQQARIEVLSTLGDVRSIKAIATLTERTEDFGIALDEVSTKSEGFTKQIEEVNKLSASIALRDLASDIENAVQQFTKWLELDSRMASFFTEMKVVVAEASAGFRGLKAVLEELSPVIEKLPQVKFFEHVKERATQNPAANLIKFVTELLIERGKAEESAAKASKSRREASLSEWKAYREALEQETDLVYAAFDRQRGFAGAGAGDYLTLLPGRAGSRESADTGGAGIESLPKSYKQELAATEEFIASQKSLFDSEIKILEAQISNKLVIRREGLEEIEALRTQELAMERDALISLRSLLEERTKANLVDKDVATAQLAELNTKISALDSELKLEKELLQIKQKGDSLKYEKEINKLLGDRTSNFYPKSTAAEEKLNDWYEKQLEKVDELVSRYVDLNEQEAERLRLTKEVTEQYEARQLNLAVKEWEDSSEKLEKLQSRVGGEHLSEYAQGVYEIQRKYAQVFDAISEEEEDAIAVMRELGGSVDEVKEHYASLREEYEQKQKQALDEYAQQHDKTLVRVREAWEDTFDSLSATLKGFFETGRLDLESFAASVKSIFAGLFAEQIISYFRPGEGATAAEAAQAGAPVSAFLSGTDAGLYSGAMTLWNEYQNPGSYNAGMAAAQSGLASMAYDISPSLGFAVSGGAYTPVTVNAAGQAIPAQGYAPAVEGGMSGTTTGMSSAAFSGWTAGIGTFLMGLAEGQDFEQAAGTGALAGAGAYGGAALGGAAAGALSGTAMGAAYGSYLGPIGAIVGAVLGTLLGGAIFGDDVKRGYLAQDVGFEYLPGAGEWVSGDTWRWRNSRGDQFEPVMDALSEGVVTRLNNITDMFSDTLSGFGGDYADQWLETVTNYQARYPLVGGGDRGPTPRDLGQVQARFFIGAEDAGEVEDDVRRLSGYVEENITGPLIQLGAQYLGDAMDGMVEEARSNGVFQYLTDDLYDQFSEGISQSIDQIRSADSTEIDRGMYQISEMFSFLSGLNSVIAEIDKNFAVSHMTEYGKQLRSLNQEFDQFSAGLAQYGVDLEKYTRLEEERALAISELNSELTGSWQDIIDTNTLDDYTLALKDLDAWFEEQQKSAEELGVSQELLTQAYQSQLDTLKNGDLISEFNSKLSLAEGGLSELEKSLSGVQEILQALSDKSMDLRYSSFDVNPLKYQEAAQDYGRLYQEALSGGASEVNKYLGFIDTYLTEQQNMYKSSQQYQEIYARVQQDISAIGVDYQSKEEVFLNQIEALSGAIFDLKDVIQGMEPPTVNITIVDSEGNVRYSEIIKEVHDALVKKLDPTVV